MVPGTLTGTLVRALSRLTGLHRPFDGSPQRPQAFRLTDALRVPYAPNYNRNGFLVVGIDRAKSG